MIQTYLHTTWSSTSVSDRTTRVLKRAIVPYTVVSLLIVQEDVKESQEGHRSRLILLFNSYSSDVSSRVLSWLGARERESDSVMWPDSTR